MTCLIFCFCKSIITVALVRCSNSISQNSAAGINVSDLTDPNKSQSEGRPTAFKLVNFCCTPSGCKYILPTSINTLLSLLLNCPLVGNTNPLNLEERVFSKINVDQIPLLVDSERSLLNKIIVFVSCRQKLCDKWIHTLGNLSHPFPC